MWEVLVAGVAVMVRDKYAVRLVPEQREELQRLIRVGKRPARVTARARVLLKSDDGWPAPQVAEALDVALGTVYRVKQRFAEEGLAGVLKDRPQANRHRKLDDRGEAHLIALACSPPPEGHDHWTLRLLAGKVVELGLRFRLLVAYILQKHIRSPQPYAISKRNPAERSDKSASTDTRTKQRKPKRPNSSIC